MARCDTKHRILFEALHLFSKSGYEGVSVRDIANAVGIKDSSLYKHYKSKQEIYDCLLKEMEINHLNAVREYGMPAGHLHEDALYYHENGLEVLKKSCISIFRFYLTDENAVRFRRMVTIEQFKNAEAGKAFRSFFVDAALDYQTKLFSEMIKIQHFHKADPALMALQFYAPIFFLWNQYDSMPEKVDEASALLESHIQEFETSYTIKG